MKIKKSKTFFILGGILILVFILKNPLDYLVYSNTLNSAPFWVTILVNGIYFLIPGLLALFCGWLFYRKGK